ncbi:hypothetical protein [Enterobacter sichuanensis]|uniref:hypothetical protein n=1 Tax=Enterobacter sichuanensis TaxID=2071710 RepID=UPI00375455E7
MNFDAENGVLKFNKRVLLGPRVTKTELFNNTNVRWEGWPEKKDNKTVSYRTILKGDHEFGDIYLIIDFLVPNDPNSIIRSWRFASEKLLMGKQNRPEGKVTRCLREWFKTKSTIVLPVSREWGHVDAAYDPHNLTGTILCHYCLDPHEL